MSPKIQQILDAGSESGLCYPEREMLKQLVAQEYSGDVQAAVYKTFSFVKEEDVTPAATAIGLKRFLAMVPETGFSAYSGRGALNPVQAAAKRLHDAAELSAGKNPKLQAHRALKAEITKAKVESKAPKTEPAAIPATFPAAAFSKPEHFSGLVEQSLATAGQKAIDDGKAVIHNRQRVSMSYADWKNEQNKQ